MTEIKIDCKSCCCYFILFIFFLMFLSLFTNIEKYELSNDNSNGHHRGGTDSLIFTYQNEENEMGSPELLHLSDKVAYKIFNSTYDACQFPYEHSCHINEPPIQTLIATENQMLYQTVMNREVVDSPFYKQCMLFHGEASHMKKIEILKNNIVILWKQLKEILDATKSSNQLELLSFKLKNLIGLRDPFSIHITTSGEYILEPSGPLISPTIDTTSLMGPSILHLYKQLEGTDQQFKMKWENTQRISTALQFESKDKFLYHFLSHVPPNTMLYESIRNIVGNEGELSDYNLLFIDREYLVNYLAIKSQFSLEQWKDYYRIQSLKILLHQHRLLVPTTQKVCKEHFKEIFPISICQYMKNQFRYDHTIFESLIQEILEEYRMYFSRKSRFDLSSVVQNEVLQMLNELRFYISQCSIMEVAPKTHEHFVKTDQQLYHFETSVLAKRSNTYTQSLNEVYRERLFRQKRHAGYETYYKRLDNRIVLFNAWFDSNLNAIYLPLGLIYFHTTHFPTDSYQFWLMAFVISHEIYHSIKHVMEPFELKSLRSIEQCINQKYNVDGLQSEAEENTADHLGLLISYRIWKRKNIKDADKILGFLLSFVRMFCTGNVNAKMENDNDDVHANDYQRSTLPLSVIRSDWLQLFSCKNKTMGAFLNKSCI